MQVVRVDLSGLMLLVNVCAMLNLCRVTERCNGDAGSVERIVRKGKAGGGGDSVEL